VDRHCEYRTIVVVLGVDEESWTPNGFV